jgi:hypothetical protein
MGHKRKPDAGAVMPGKGHERTWAARTRVSALTLKADVKAGHSGRAKPPKGNRSHFRFGFGKELLRNKSAIGQPASATARDFWFIGPAAECCANSGRSKVR